MAPTTGNCFLLGLFLTSYVVAIDIDTALLSDDPSFGQKNTCAMTQVLQAMNELLTVLSGEVRDLKKQVQTSCRSSDGGGTSGRRPRPPKPKQGPTEGEDEVADPFGDYENPEDNPETADGTEDEYGYDGEAPGDDLIEGISKWWGTFSPFAKPTDAPPSPPSPQPPARPTEAPRPSYTGGHSDYDDRWPSYDYGRGQTDDGEDDDDADADDNDLSSPYDPRGDSYDPGSYYGGREDESTYVGPNPQYLPATTPQPLITEPPFLGPLPPEPTSCKAPFRQQAGGCFIVFHDPRDWRSWGEAHAFCQNYGGTLASPYRLSKLQSFLSRYYSDAFWVGAKFDVPSRSWKWLSGKPLAPSEWKPDEPNQNRGMKCILLDRWSGYRASNAFCGEKYPFICDYREPQNL